MMPSAGQRSGTHRRIFDGFQREAVLLDAP